MDERKPALIIPYYKPDGTNSIYCMRPDNPRVLDDKKKGKLPDGTYPQKVFKYEMPKGVGNVLDCHPAIIPHLKDPTRPLVFTEGAKKADSLISHGYLAINLNGVWGWRGTGSATQGKTALPDFEDIALNGRKCYLLFDSDVMVKDSVKEALRRLRSYLLSKDAQVIPVILPHTDTSKTGVDDYFASGKTAAELNALLTLFEVFPPHLESTSRKKWKTQDILDWYEGQQLVFAISDMSETLTLNGRRVDDTQRAIIRTQLRDAGIPISHAEDTQILAGDTRRFHPIKDYFKGLEWNGQTDHIALLASFIKDKEGVFYDWLKRWLIGAVAKVMGDGKHQNFVLALVGGQGKGKSEFARWLCPLPRLFIEAPLNPDDKDSFIRMVNNFIWELGELGAVTHRADREALKQIISHREVKVRPPYGAGDIEKPVTVSFIGTVNDEGGGFLNDPTGNRRYASVTVEDIDWSYTDLDVDDIWGQAYHLYLQGEPWMLTAEEACRRDEVNQMYQTEDPFEPMIEAKFDIDPSKTNDPKWAMTSTDILWYLDVDPTRRDFTMRLAAVLKIKGLAKDTVKRVGEDRDGHRVYSRFWRGIRRKDRDQPRDQP